MKTPIDQILEGVAGVQPIHFLGVAIVAAIAVPLMMIYRYRRPKTGLRKNANGDWVNSLDALQESATEEQIALVRRRTGFEE